MSLLNETTKTTTREALELLDRLAIDSTQERVKAMGALGLTDGELEAITGKETVSLREGTSVLDRESMRRLDQSCWSAALLLRRFGDPELTIEALRQPRELLEGESIIEGFATQIRAASQEAMSVAISMIDREAA